MKFKYIFLFLILIFVSCSEDEDVSIIGTWKLEKVNTNQQIENYDQYSSAMNQLIKTTSIQINEDHSFGGTIWGDTSFGYWTVKKDSLIVEDLSNSNKFSVYIKELTPTTLVLQEQADTVIEILTFNRVNLQ